MGDVNRMILVGRLGADPDLKYTKSGTAVCNLKVATTDAYKDSSGERQARTEWHRVVCWGKTAENCKKYLAKGKMVYIEGSLQTESYEKDGQKHYTANVRVDKITFLSPAGDKAGAGRQVEREPGGDDEDVPY